MSKQEIDEFPEELMDKVSQDGFTKDDVSSWEEARALLVVEMSDFIRKEIDEMILIQD
jgi:hypothetical protein